MKISGWDWLLLILGLVLLVGSVLWALDPDTNWEPYLVAVGSLVTFLAAFGGIIRRNRQQDSGSAKPFIKQSQLGGKNLTQIARKEASSDQNQIGGHNNKQEIR